MSGRPPIEIRLGAAVRRRRPEEERATPPGRPQPFAPFSADGAEPPEDESPAGKAPAQKAPAQTAPAEPHSHPALDPAIYDYDAALDQIRHARQNVSLDRQQEKLERKPKYMSQFMQSAQLRQRDQQRAESKMIQRQREREGDTFADTESFVTDAYRAHLDQVKRDEQREEQELQAEREKQRRARETGAGMTDMPQFRKELLRRQEQQHAALVQATAAPLHGMGQAEAEAEARQADVQRQTQGDGSPPLEQGRSHEQHAKPSAGPDSGATETDHDHLVLLAQARAQGKQIELNEEGQIVDERQLLSTGLNVLRRPQNQSQGPGGRDQSGDRDRRHRHRVWSSTDRLEAHDPYARSHRAARARGWEPEAPRRPERRPDADAPTGEIERARESRRMEAQLLHVTRDERAAPRDAELAARDARVAAARARALERKRKRAGPA